MARTSRTHLRALALLAVVAVVVIGLAFGVSPSKSAVSTSTTTVRPVADSPGIGAARQACTLFATLISDLQAGKVTPADLTARVKAVDQQAAAASKADQPTFAKLASDAHAFDLAVSANDTTSGQAAQTLATDCQGILGSTPTGT